METPCLDTAFHVGLRPTTPQYDAGRMTLPAVCAPIHRGTCWSATAAAEPVLLPPGVRCALCGLLVGGPIDELESAMHSTDLS